MKHNPAINFSHVSQEIQGSTVLSDINLGIQLGERWAIVGPNGSGKTTLLKIINGYLRPSKGSVSVLGQVFGETSLPELRKSTGFVSSYLDNLLVSDDNVLDVVVSGKGGTTRLWGIPSRNDVSKAERILKELGCLRFAGRRLNELSQGERQKVLIGRSLMADPRILTFDEACASLDLGSRESFLSGVESISKDRPRLVMVYVTHRIDEIPPCFEKAILLKRGSILAEGDIEKVITGRNLSNCFEVDVEVKRIRGRLYPIVSR